MTTWKINERTQDNSFVFRSGLRMQVTPEGDCRECTFVAQGKGLGLRPLDPVTITCDGQALFYGEIRVGGNTADVDGHQYTVRSMALRLKEVTIPEGWVAPQQDAGLTVTSLINAVLPQVGDAFTVGEISLPFDCRAIKDAAQQTPYALLEQIASDGAGLGVNVRFGVNAQRQFFCVAANEDVATLTSDMMTGQTKWTAPVAEMPCTAVLWYVAKKPDGSWLTHKSIAPEATIYGVRTKAVSLTTDEGLWETVTGTYYSGKKGESGWEMHLFRPTWAEWMTDSETAGYGVGAIGGEVRIAFTPDVNTTVTRYVLAATIEAPNVKPNLQAGIIASADEDLGSLPPWNWISTFEPTILKTVYIEPQLSSQTFEVSNMAIFTDTSGKLIDQTLTVYELRPESLNTDALDKAAQYYYSIPAEQPADIELRGLFINRVGRMSWGSWQSTVDVYEYRISAERGLCTGVLAGQADDPAKLAQAELIKARDDRSVIRALIAKE